MNIDIPNLIFAIAFCCYVGIRGTYSKQRKKVEIVDNRRGVLEVALLISVGLSSLLFPAVFLITNLLSFADYFLPTSIRVIGLVLLPVSLFLFYRSHSDLGENWSATLNLRKDHQLITKGVYSRVRHPMYTSIILWNLAQGVILENWMAGWVAMASFALLLAFRVPREERMMTDHFGQAYLRYMSRTGALWPRLRRQ